MMLAAFEGRFEMLQDLVDHGGHDPVTVSNHRGLSVQAILASEHGKALFQVGLPDEDSLLEVAEDNAADVIRACLDAKTNVDCTYQRCTHVGWIGKRTRTPTLICIQS